MPLHKTKKAPPKSSAKSGYKKTTATSDTAKGMSRLSPSPKKLNAKGAKGKMTSTMKGSGLPLTKKVKGASKKTRKQPSLY